ncbi:hypothetical protein Bbelb_262110 [Branchiostoma belcheri]|nr:hypothetical protein Bbelb_262110 [Branchiostoma belcheri]
MTQLRYRGGTGLNRLPPTFCHVFLTYENRSVTPIKLLSSRTRKFKPYPHKNSGRTQKFVPYPRKFQAVPGNSCRYLDTTCELLRTGAEPLGTAKKYRSLSRNEESTASVTSKTGGATDVLQPMIHCSRSHVCYLYDVTEVDDCSFFDKDWSCRVENVGGALTRVGSVTSARGDSELHQTSLVVPKGSDYIRAPRRARCVRRYGNSSASEAAGQPARDDGVYGQLTAAGPGDKLRRDDDFLANGPASDFGLFCTVRFYVELFNGFKDQDMMISIRKNISS